MNPGMSQPEKSEELVIDTHKGKEEGIILPEDSQNKDEDSTTLSSAIIDNEVTNKTDDDLDEEREIENDILQLSGDILRESAVPTQHQVEAIAGMGAAFAVFLVLLIWRWRNRCVTSPHVKLVEDDFLTSDLFKGNLLKLQISFSLNKVIDTFLNSV